MKVNKSGVEDPSDLLAIRSHRALVVRPDATPKLNDNRRKCPFSILDLAKGAVYHDVHKHTNIDRINHVFFLLSPSSQCLTRGTGRDDSGRWWRRWHSMAVRVMHTPVSCCASFAGVFVRGVCVFTVASHTHTHTATRRRMHATSESLSVVFTILKHICACVV